MSSAEKPDIGSFLAEARFSDGVEVSTCHNYVELELSEARFDRWRAGCGDFMDVPSVNEQSEQNVTTSDTRVLFFSDRVEWNVLVIALKLPFKSFRLNRDITLKLFHREDTRKIIQKYTGQYTSVK